MNTTLVILVTLALSAWFSGMEIAFMASSRLKIELDKGKGLMAARILSSFSREPAHLLGTILLANNAALVIFSMAMAGILDPIILRVLPEQFHAGFLVLLIQTLIATLIILLVAEFLPKALFRINPNAILNLFALPLWLMYYLLYPIVYLFRITAEFILKKVFRVSFDKKEMIFTPIDLDAYVRELAAEENRHEEVQQEIQMFQNVIDFRKVKIRECMVPRNEMVAIEEDEPVAELRRMFSAQGVSRIPVYHETIDNITGYAHAFDIFRQPESIRSILKPILFVPETMPANIILSRFIRERKNIAVVLDEFGGTSGMVTMEDVIEEIFGEIEDEFDDVDRVEKMSGRGEYLFSARLEIDYLNDKYKLGLPVSEEYETLAGLIIQHHENIPAIGETILIPGFRFEILSATETRIEQVKLRIDKDD